MSTESASFLPPLEMPVKQLVRELRVYVGQPAGILVRWSVARNQDYAMKVAEKVASCVGLTDIAANIYARQIQLSVIAHAVPSEQQTQMREMLQDDLETIVREQITIHKGNIHGYYNREELISHMQQVEEWFSTVSSLGHMAGVAFASLATEDSTEMDDIMDMLIEHRERMGQLRQGVGMK